MNRETGWQEARRKIEKFLTDYLYKIEWYYGEGRAPFAYPPRFVATPAEKPPQFSCRLLPDFSAGETLEITSPDPAALPDRVRAEVIARFGEMDEKIRQRTGGEPE